MKLRRSDVRRQAHALPTLRFENHALTSFAGLVLFQQLFATLDLKARLRRCFRRQAGGKAFGPATIFLQLIVHIVLGFRELREACAYRDDPMVQRLLGLRRLPDVATVMSLSPPFTSISAVSVRPIPSCSICLRCDDCAGGTFLCQIEGVTGPAC